MKKIVLLGIVMSFIVGCEKSVIHPKKSYSTNKLSDSINANDNTPNGERRDVIEVTPGIWWECGAFAECLPEVGICMIAIISDATYKVDNRDGSTDYYNVSFVPYKQGEIPLDTIKTKHLNVAPYKNKTLIKWE